MNAAGDRREFTDFNVEWFADGFDELMVEVKKKLNTEMAPTMEAKFATKAYLHKWLVDKVISARIS